MEKIKLAEFVDKAQYQKQYVDGIPGVWTVPVLFTEKRMNDILSDLSVSKLKLITEDTEFELDIM